MVTKYFATDISWDEAPGGVAVLNAYGDPLTKAEPWTIGFGSTGADIRQDTVWTPEYAAMRRDMMIEDIKDHCTAQFSWWDAIIDERQDVFVNMGYQMGWQGLLKFTATLAAEARGAYETAAANMRASLWDRQTHARAERLAEQMRTGVRLPRSYDHLVTDALTTNGTKPAPVIVPAQPKENTAMSLVSSALNFIWDHTFAANARAAASSDPNTAAVGLAAITATTAANGSVAVASVGTANSPAGLASPPIAALENAINDLVANFIKTSVDQLPAVGAVAEMTGLDQKVADAAKAMLVLGEQHALTYLSSAFSRGHQAVNSVTVVA